MTGAPVRADVKFQACLECGLPWSMPASEYTWWLVKSKSMPPLFMPTRCLECRNKKETKSVPPAVSVPPSGVNICLSAAGNPKTNYASFQMAEAVEQRNRRVGRPQQFPYKCPSCDSFHLASHPPIDFVSTPGAPRISQMRYESTQPSKFKGVRGAEGETRERVRELSDTGRFTVVEMAEKLSVSIGTVYSHLKSIRDEQYPKHKQQSVASASPLDNIALRKSRLQKEMDDLINEERRLKVEEERRKRETILSITRESGGFLVKKQQERMLLTVDSFRELIEQARQINDLQGILGR
jgi:hypothetical protein